MTVTISREGVGCAIGVADGQIAGFADNVLVGDPVQRTGTRFLHKLGPVDKPSPNTDAFEQDESDEAGGEFVISSGNAPLLLEMANEALNP